MRIHFCRALTMVHYILQQPLCVGLHPALTYNYNTVLPPSAALRGPSEMLHSLHLKMEAQTFCFYYKSVTERVEQNQSAVKCIMSCMISTPYPDTSKTLSRRMKWMVHTIYRVIQEEFAILWEMIVCVILSKKVHMNRGPILNGYRDNGKEYTDHPASTNSNYVINNITTNITCIQVLTIVLLMVGNGYTC